VTKHGEDAVERERVASVAKQHGMTSATFLDVDGSWSSASGLGNVPSFLVVGRDGIAKYRAAGTLKEGSEEFEALALAIEKELGASG